MEKKSVWKIWAPAIFALIILGFIVFLIFNKNGKFEFFEVKEGDLIITTEVFGRVVPGEELDLSFETTGKVSVINVRIGDGVKTGDILARTNSAEISSEIDQAIADLESQKARLDELTGSSDAQSKIESNKQILASRLKKSFVSADDIVRNQVDLFISEPTNRFPKFDQSLSSFFVRVEIQEKRYEIEKMLERWKIDSDNIDNENVSFSDAQKFISNLKEIESLLSLISTNSTDFVATNEKSRAQIDAYLSSISQARNTISTMIVDINSATEALRSVEAEMPVLRANVNSAQASLDRLSARAGNYVIRAPFDGVIVDRDVELGVVVTAGQKAFSMISDRPLEIESFIPEINIGGVDVGDKANIVLDAFGDDKIFEAAISHIDPRETIKDGVTTYRILLGFIDFDKSILSGMSAEIEIEKDVVAGQIIIPRYLIKTEDNQSFVEVLRGGEVVKREIRLGQRDNRGNVVIISGLDAGEKVIIPQ